MKIVKFFPIVAFIFSIEKGLSSSEAQRRKEDNKNKTEKELKTLESPIYIEKREIFGSNGNYSENRKKLEYTVKPENFSVIGAIANRNKENAWFGQALILKDNLRVKVGLLSQEEIAAAFGIEHPHFETKGIVQKRATLMNIDHYCELDKSEELIRNASMELLEKIGYAKIRELLELEAIASTYGKRVHSDSFLMKLERADFSVGKNSMSNESIIVNVVNVLAYNKNDFEAITEELREKYTEYQMQRNGVFKFIKDTARALERQYQEEYIKEQNQYYADHSVYQDELKLYKSKVEAIRTELLQEVAALRILE